jgi:hypothetical protein
MKKTNVLIDSYMHNTILKFQLMIMRYEQFLIDEQLCCSEFIVKVQFIGWKTLEWIVSVDIVDLLSLLNLYCTACAYVRTVHTAVEGRVSGGWGMI